MTFQLLNPPPLCHPVTGCKRLAESAAQAVIGKQLKAASNVEHGSDILMAPRLEALRHSIRSSHAATFAHIVQRAGHHWQESQRARRKEVLEAVVRSFFRPASAV